MRRSTYRMAEVFLGVFLLLTSPAAVVRDYSLHAPLSAQVAEAHAPILITSDAEFTIAQGVRSGSGTPADPFVISDWAITAPRCSEWSRCAASVQVNNTTSTFIVRNLELSAGSAAGTNNTTLGVGFFGVRHARIESVTTSGIMVGLAVESSSDVAVADVRLNATVPSRGWKIGTYFGLDIRSSSQVEVTNLSIAPGFDEPLFVWNVSHVDFRRVQFERTSTYGLMAFGVDNLTVSNSSLASDTYAAHIWDSRDVSLIDNTVNASFLVAVHRSSRVTFAGNEIPEVLQSLGDFVGVNGFTAYHNNFLRSRGYAATGNTTTNVSMDAGYPGGGNYWSDYPGTDNCSGPDQSNCSNRDGIGDAAYRLGQYDFGIDQYIESPFIDRYPLIRPWPLPSVSPHVVLTVTPGSGDPRTQFSLDGSRSWDARDAFVDLQFWFSGEYNGGGLFSTGWSNRSTYNATFALSGAYQVTLKVRNTAGLVGEVAVVLQVAEPPISGLILLVVLVPALVMAVLVVLYLRLRKAALPEDAPDDPSAGDYASREAKSEDVSLEETASGKPPGT